MARTPATAKRALPLPALLAIFLLAAVPVHAGPGVLTPIGPGDGPLESLVVHPLHPGKVWIGFPAGGVDRSDDRGGSWRWAGRPLAGQGVAALAADPAVSGGLWAATRSGVFRTTNSGGTWTRLSGPTYAAALGDADPRSLTPAGGALYVQTLRRLLATRDGGATWEVVFEVPDGNALLQLAAGPWGLFLATSGGSGSELLRSTDGGITWASVAGDWGTAIAQIEVTTAAVYVTRFRDGELELLRSLDGGATWQRLLEVGSAGPFAIDGRQPGTMWALAGSPVRLWLSRDGGSTWRRRGPAPLGTRLTVEPGSEVLYVSSFESLARTLDGGRTWRTVLRRLVGEGPPARVAFQPGNPARMALVVGNRLALSENAGLSWRMPSPETRLTDVDLDPANPDRLLGTFFNEILVSGDGGRTWARQPGLFSYVEQLVRTGRRTLFAGGCGLERSADNGRSWRVSLPCGSRYSPSNLLRIPRKLVVDPGDPATLYALTAQVLDFYPNYATFHERPSILWKSEDGGASWRKVGQNLKAVAVSPLGGRVFAVRGLDLLVSDDGARTWRTLSRLPRAAYDLVVPAGNPNAFYALFESGVLYTGNGGVWTEYRPISMSGFHVGALSALVPHPADPRTVFVTSHGAVFHLRVP